MRSSDNPPPPSLSSLDRSRATRPRPVDRVSAHAAAAQFKAAAEDRPIPAIPADQQPGILSPVVQHYLQAAAPIETETLRQQLEPAPRAERLPAAWYRDGANLAELDPPDRTAQVVKYGTAAGLVACGVVAMWFAIRAMPSPEVPLVTVFVQEQAAEQASTAAPQTLTATKLEPPSAQGGVTTAQILAVAERFVATGDVLAARAMLSARAAAGEPRAQFALAETYDPNMLSFWNASGIEANVSYARLLYETARRNGLPEAQARLDALR